MIFAVDLSIARIVFRIDELEVRSGFDSQAHRLDPLERGGGIEEFGVDTVADDMDSLRAGLFAEQRRFLLADQQAGVGARGGRAFIAAQQPRLTAHEPALQPARLAAIGFELRRIHVDEIHDHPLPWARRKILRHLAGKDVDRVDRVPRQHPFDRIAQRGIVERGQRHRLAREQRLNRGDHAGLRTPDDRTVAGIGSEPALALQVSGIVGERDQVDAALLRQVLQDIEAANLVAAVGRIGNPVRQEKDVTHQPRPLEIRGPSRFAAQSGSFFHTAI